MVFSRNKNGNAILDTTTILIFMFVLAVVILATYVVYGKIDQNVGALMGNNVTSNSTGYNIVHANYVRFPDLFDNIYLFVFVASWITALIASFLIDTHPIFFAFSVLLLVMVMISSVYISNYYQNIVSSTAEYTAAEVQFPKMSFIMNHLLEMTIGIGFSITFVLFAKTRL